MNKLVFLIIISFILCGGKTSAVEQLCNLPQVVVTDNRIESKDIVYNISVEGIEYKCRLSHKKWHQLQISSPFVLQEDGLAASLTGAFWGNENSYKNKCSFPPLFWRKLQEKISISASEKFMTNIITNKKQDMFLFYFQEILNLEVYSPATQQVHVLELPSRRSATVVVNFENMRQKKTIEDQKIDQ